jgi:hypothetical protein
MTKEFKPADDALFDDPRHLGNYPAMVRPTAEPALRPLEVNGAPVVERSHEFVIKKQAPNAQD